MQIKHLPQHLQQIALKEAELQGRTDTTVETYLISAFYWVTSSKGEKFWSNIHDGNFNTDEHGS